MLVLKKKCFSLQIWNERSSAKGNKLKLTALWFTAHRLFFDYIFVTNHRRLCVNFHTKIY